MLIRWLIAFSLAVIGTTAAYASGPQEYMLAQADASAKHPGFFKSLLSGKLFKKHKKETEQQTRVKGWPAIAPQQSKSQIHKAQVSAHKKQVQTKQVRKSNSQTQRKHLHKSKPHKLKLHKAKKKRNDSSSGPARWPWGGAALR